MSDKNLYEVIDRLEIDIRNQKQDINHCLRNVDTVLSLIAQQQEAMDRMSAEILRLEKARLKDRKKHPFIRFWDSFKYVARKYLMR
jgi:hypothetical protein